MDTLSCKIFDTKSDDKKPSDFISHYHVHILVRKGQLKFSDTRTEYISSENDLVIWQMSNTIVNVTYSDDFEALFMIASPDFLSKYNPEMIWATQGFIFIRLNPSFHLEGENLELISSDFSQMLCRQKHNDALFGEEILGRIFQIFLFDLWHVYSNGIGKMKVDDNSSKIFLRFVLLLQENILNHREVSFYADKLCISSKYLSEICHRVTNLPASEWISYYATSTLVSLLNDNSKSLSQITDEMNFPSLSFFSRYVKRQLGVSPNDYRKKKNP